MNVLLQRGIDAARSGRPGVAADCFAQVLATDDANTMVRAWLGQALCASRRQKAGTQELRCAAEQLIAQGGPSCLSRVVEIIVQLQQWADVFSALDLADALARLFPSDAKVQRLRAMCLHQLNRPADALAACRSADALGAPDPMMQVLEASIELENGLVDAAEARLRGILASDAAPMVRFRACKELSRARDKAAAYDEAFDLLSRAENAARAMPEFQRVDLGLVPGRIASHRRSFTTDLMGRWSQASFDDRGAPVFIVGFYRSGTTLAQEVLDTHPRCFVADEANFLHEALRELHTLQPGPADDAAKLRALDREGIQRLRDAYWEAARGRYGGAVDDTLFIDKFTLNTVDLGFINTVFPDAKVIFLVRDPRDVCLSCYMQLMPATPATAHLLSWESTAAFYADVMDWWFTVRERLTLPWIEIRYEDAVADFEGTFRDVLSFLELEWDPALLGFHQRAATKFVGSPSRHQVAQPLYSSSLRRWRHYERHFAPIAARLAPFVERFGYAPP